MRGLIEIFYEPGKVFERVRERGAWLAPFIAVTLLTMLTGIIAINLIGMETITRKALESNQRMISMIGQEKVDQIVRSSNTPASRIRAYAGSALKGAIYLLVIAGVFTGLLAMMNARVKFRQVLGAAGYALFPFMLITCVMTALILLLSNDRGELDLNNLIALNPGAFLNRESTSKPVYSLASSVDLISFGEVGMLAYGLAKVSGVSFAKCLTMVVALWALVVLLKAGMAAAF